MRTRSQSPPPVVEPFNLVEPLENPPPPLSPMDDQRTMAQLLEATPRGFEEAIIHPCPHPYLQHDHILDEFRTSRATIDVIDMACDEYFKKFLVSNVIRVAIPLLYYDPIVYMFLQHLTHAGTVTFFFQRSRSFIAIEERQLHRKWIKYYN
ncbi:hypothetical protein Tco_0789502 [Tanacetum coccineum]